MTREKEIRQEMSKIAGTHPDWNKNDCMRMGFYDGQVHNLDEIGLHLGISKETVRQSIIRILKKIKEEYEKIQT